MNYDQYLDSLGLTADERRIMDTPARRQAYEGAFSAITAERDAEKRKRVDYEGKVDTWYNTTVEKMAAKDTEVIAARAAEAAKLTGACKAAKDAGIDGLADIAKSIGIDVDGSQPPLDPHRNVN